MLRRVHPASSLLGHYELGRCIGEGSFGAVYEARHIAIEGRFAIKLLRAEYCSDQQQINRLFDEARAANRIGHQGIVQVLHCDFHEGIPYLVMEYIDGQTLERRLAEAPMAWSEAICLAYQLSGALQAAHAQGVIHRDLKPSNIILLTDPFALDGVRTKIVDFGIAKIPRPHPRALQTQVGTVLGTPAYMSPEQCQAQPADGKTDVYSLGIILYEMLAGALPFQHSELGPYILAHCSAPPPPLADRVPAAPARLRELAHEMLAKSPMHRPDMAAVANALGKLRQAHAGASALPAAVSAQARSFIPPVMLNNAPTEVIATSSRRPANWRRHSLPLVAMVLLGSAIWLWTAGRPNRNAPQPVSNAQPAPSWPTSEKNISELSRSTPGAPTDTQSIPSTSESASKTMIENPQKTYEDIMPIEEYMNLNKPRKKAQKRRKDK